MEATFFGPYEVSERVITKSKHAFAIPAQMPIVPGHILICPHRIVEKIEDLTSDEFIDLISLLKEMKLALKAEFQAEGFNVAWNEALIAGQTVPHLHLHLLPRKSGDSGILGYEPRKFLYRPGERENSPDEELIKVAKSLSKYF